ncbi:DUF7210 family protein [Schinkia azotoformans]|nr:hypothetical protein [Schinkia azotoformans]MEC1714757.1 hypothetical protein [Schinkia azotoformans]MEC1757487.1 hypothetical protein [Schinkia azotoformans]
MDVTVKGKVKHNGKWLEEGETLRCKEEEGERLVKLGVAEEVKKETTKK